MAVKNWIESNQFAFILGASTVAISIAGFMAVQLWTLNAGFAAMTVAIQKVEEKTVDRYTSKDNEIFAKHLEQQRQQDLDIVAIKFELTQSQINELKRRTQ